MSYSTSQNVGYITSSYVEKVHFVERNITDTKLKSAIKPLLQQQTSCWKLGRLQVAMKSDLKCSKPWTKEFFGWLVCFIQVA